SSASTSWEPPGWLVQKSIFCAGSTSAKSRSRSSVPPPPSPPTSGPPQAARPRAPAPAAPRPNRERRLRPRGRWDELVMGQFLSGWWADAGASAGHAALGEAGDDVPLQHREDEEDGRDHQHGAGHEDAPARAGVAL